MNKKYNAAIYLLSSRTEFIYDCLKNLFDNWNYFFDYPVYVHYFGNIYNRKFIKKINTEISNNIHFVKTSHSIPGNIKEIDLFYNRKDIPYVCNSFGRDRIGYLHMEWFVSNITAFGEIGCLSKKLENYDYLMRIDDDSWFKGKIDFDFFDVAKEYPLVTGFTWNHYNDNIRDTRVELWNFYRNFIADLGILPKNEVLRTAIVSNNESLMHNMHWSCGNLNVYSMKHFKNKNWYNFINCVNDFGGQYKYRWGDIEIIGLYLNTFFSTPMLSLDLREKGVYDPQLPSVTYAPSIKNYGSPLQKIGKKIFNMVVKK